MSILNARFRFIVACKRRSKHFSPITHLSKVTPHIIDPKRTVAHSEHIFEQTTLDAIYKYFTVNKRFRNMGTLQFHIVNGHYKWPILNISAIANSLRENEATISAQIFNVWKYVKQLVAILLTSIASI